MIFPLIPLLLLFTVISTLVHASRSTWCPLWVPVLVLTIAVVLLHFPR